MLCLPIRHAINSDRHGRLAYLKVSVDDRVRVAMVDTFENLLDAVRRVRLRVELPGHNILEKLASRNAEKIKMVTGGINSFRF